MVNGLEKRLTSVEDNILVVDANPSDLSSIDRALLGQGCFVDSTISAEEAMDKVMRSSYKIMIIGYHGPPQNEDPLLKFVRESSPDTSVIVLTPAYDEALDHMLLEQGVSVILEKPIKPARLQANVRNSLKLSNSIFDPKTNLYTSDVLKTRLDEELNLLGANQGAKPARKYLSHDLSVLLMDLDRFKQINDSYGGHIEGGDRVLREVGKLIKGHTRPGDIHGRYGGDELALVFRGLDYETALKKAEILRSTVEGLGLTHQGRIIPTTLTIGVVTLPQEGISLTFNDVMAAADRALYHGKKSGRNKVIGYQSTAK